MRDNSGNWWVLVEPKPFTAADFGGGPRIRFLAIPRRRIWCPPCHKKSAV